MSTIGGHPAFNNFVKGGGILPQNNVAARQAAIAAAHPRLPSQQVSNRANLQVFQTLKRAGQLNQYLPVSVAPSTYGPIGTTQYTTPGYTNNGPTAAQTPGYAGSTDYSSQPTGLAVGAASDGSNTTTPAPTGIAGIWASFSTTQQTLLIVGIVGIGGFLLFREFKRA